MKLLLSMAALLVMAADSALAQQEGVAGGSDDRPSLFNIVTLAGIEAVQKDLGVSDDVVRKLMLLRADHRAAVQNEYEKAGINLQASQGRVTAEQQRKMGEIWGNLINEFIPKTMELLSPDQQKRIQQIELQARLKSDPRALLAPNVASELNLTDGQMQSLNALYLEMRGKIAGGNTKGSTVSQRLAMVPEEYAAKAVEILTAKQKETLSKLKGTEFDVAKIIPGGPGGRKGAPALQRESTRQRNGK